GAGTYILRWTISNAPCPDFTDDMELIVSNIPTSEAGDNQTICVDMPATLNAQAMNGTGLWSVFSGPNLMPSQFSDPASPTSQFSPAGGAGNYVLRWTVSAPGCMDVIDDVTITANATTDAVATP